MSARSSKIDSMEEADNCGNHCSNGSGNDHVKSPCEKTGEELNPNRDGGRDGQSTKTAQHPAPKGTAKLSVHEFRRMKMEMLNKSFKK